MLKQKVDEILECESDRFTDLVSLSGLEPKSAFKFANLSGVDFSECDLTEFDFTGANLIGCDFSSAEYSLAIFSGAVTDNTTIFGPCRQDLSSLKPKHRLSIITLTPNGDQVVLPLGSTAIDFAYAVHTDVGHGLTSVLINGQISDISVPLKNGQVVEIQVSQDHLVQETWLSHAFTDKAKRKIVRKLQQINAEYAIENCEKSLRNDIAEIESDDGRIAATEVVDLVLNDQYLFGRILRDARHCELVLDAVLIGYLCLPERRTRNFISGKIPAQQRKLVFCRRCFPLPHGNLIGQHGSGQTILHNPTCALILNDKGENHVPLSWGRTSMNTDEARHRFLVNSLAIQAQIASSIHRYCSSTKCEKPRW